jgi:hypothetical protein
MTLNIFPDYKHYQLIHSVDKQERKIKHDVNLLIKF